MTDRTVLVTGSGGFLGSRLVEALYLSEFAKPRAGIRRWANASRIARFPVEFAPCDITKPGEIAVAVQGCDAVVHCAYAGTRELIVDGTRNMLEAALAAGVRRFVYVSSAEVYGPEASGLLDETVECRPSGRMYGDAKLEAERLVMDFNKRGLQATILRPSIIYGPFSQSWTIDVATRLQSGNWGRFEELGDGIANVVYVDDLVRAIFKAIDEDAAVGEIFNIVGSERPTWNEYFERFNNALGLPPLRVISSAQAARSSSLRDRVGSITGKVVDRFQAPLMRIYLRGGPISNVMKLVRTKLKTTPTSAELKGLYGRRADFSSEKAARVLDFQPEVDLKSGLAVCREWLDFHGYLSTPS
jgi:nucleoside-diphosphate-sugar epimerase